MGFDISQMRAQLKQSSPQGIVAPAPPFRPEPDAVQATPAPAPITGVGVSADSAPYAPSDAANRPQPSVSTEPKSHTATRGLFAHICANHLKSIFLIASFAVSVFLLQAAFFTLIIPPSVPLDRVFSPIDAIETVFAVDHVQKIQGNPVTADKPTALRQTFSSLESSVRTGFGETSVAEVTPTRFVAANARDEELMPRSFFGDLKNIWRNIFTSGILFQFNSSYLLILCMLHVVCSVIYASIFVRRQQGATRISRADAQTDPKLAQFYRIVEKLTVGRGLPMPALEVISSSARNAYAGGFHPKNASIGVTTGLLDCLNRLELEAVLAHEVAHIEGRDNRLMTIANCSAGLFSHYAGRFQEALSESPKRIVVLSIFAVSMFGMATVFAAVALYLSAYLIAAIAQMMISRRRELIADARAIEFMKMPAALISGLRKVAVDDRIIGLDRAAQAMMISNLSGGGLPTHPSLEARIRAIEETTTVSAADIAAVARMSDGVATADGSPYGASGGQTFGKLASGSHQTDGAIRETAQSWNADAPVKLPLLENEKLDGVYKATQAVGNINHSIASSLSKLWVLYIVLPLILGLGTLLTASLSLAIGIQPTPGLIAVVSLGIAAFLWWAKNRFRRKRNA